MKRSDKMLRKVFEAEINTSRPRAAELVEIVATPSPPPPPPPPIPPPPTPPLVPHAWSLVVEAPLHSPITPIDRNTFISGGAAEMDEIVATPEAPLYSPVTPIDQNNFLSGGAAEFGEMVATPEAPLYSPITPIDRNTFLSGGNVIIPESSENSSPVRSMSPDTLNLFETLNHCDFSDDDSVKDPNFIADKDIHNSSSDESTSHINMAALVHAEKPLSSDYYRTSETTEQPEIIHDNDVSTSLLAGDVTQESQKVAESNSRPLFEAVVSKPLKRRYSENDLQQFHQTHQPLKKLRSASISITYEDRVQDKPKSKSPKKKHISDPSKWKRHVERKKRLKGEAYRTIKGKLVSAMPLKQPKCLAIPKHKCNSNVPKEARNNIYESFRTLETLEAQRQFIIQHVKKDKKKRSTKNGPSRKDFTHQYSFTIGHEKVSVCRDFFLDTLNIKEGIVRGALKKVSSEGVLLADARGKKSPSNKLSNDRVTQIKEHIFSFPAMESHYCRKNTEYKYLDSGLNIRIMYSLYKEKCEREGTKPAGIETYRKVFRSYKLRFHVPKKDLCKKCVAYKEIKSNDVMTNAEDDSYSKHLKRRDDAYLRRDADKEAANNEKKTLAFNFDLEAVLQTPKGASGPFFYVRKLAVYNLTFYKFGDQDVDCFTWDETEGKRGSTEIATCVYKYISSKQDISHVRMMSDNCGGQQKNFNFSCMLLYLVTNNPTIHTIDHVFYESGHSHMECDSIHSKIEQKCKNSAVYTPDGWIQVMRLARTNPRPFNVNVLVHEEFLDFNPNQCQFAEEITRKPNQRKKISNKEKRNNELERNEQQVETRKEKTNFQDAVWIQYRKDSPKSIFIKTDYNDDSFKELKIKSKRGKTALVMPVPVYTERIPISKLKKRDLLKLCVENQIPKYYHSFYQNLPDSDTAEDRLPQPDAEEVEDP